MQHQLDELEQHLRLALQTARNHSLFIIDALFGINTEDCQGFLLPVGGVISNRRRGSAACYIAVIYKNQFLNWLIANKAFIATNNGRLAAGLLYHITM